MPSFTQRYGGSILLAVLAFAYLTRMYQLHIPSSYMFDEVYHAVTAKLISHNDPRAFEWWNPPPEANTAVDWLHPPLAKYTQAVSILAFGENSFGWRFSSVIFGTLSILMVYHLSQQIFKNQNISLLATALASLDGLLLVQSRIAMNDIHLTFFILLALFVYLKYRDTTRPIFLLLTGIVLGCAIASKWTGVFIWAAIIMLEILRLLATYFSTKGKVINKYSSLSKLVKDAIRWIVFLLVIPPLIYLLSYSMMFGQGKDWQHFINLHKQIWYYQTHLEATHPYQSKPWQWILNLRPVWYYVEYQGKTRADIYAFGNSVVLIGGLVAAALSVGLICTDFIAKIKNKSVNKAIVALNHSRELIVILPYLLLWVPWLFSPRIMFFYHYTPAVPLLCIIFAYWLRKFFLWSNTGKYLTVTIILLAFLHFIVWYPHWVGIPLSFEIKNSLYFRFSNWQ